VLYYQYTYRTPLPTKITVLKSAIRPNECGDTIFADTHAAYDGLDDTLKAELHGLKGYYCYLKTRIQPDGSTENLKVEEITAAADCAVHPLVTTHPVTGRLNLYANLADTASVIGYSQDASDALLQKLFEHTAKPEYAMRHTYNDGDLIIIDNRGTFCASSRSIYVFRVNVLIRMYLLLIAAVQHRATECPSRYPRMLVRTTVSNDYPPAFDPAVVSAAHASLRPEGRSFDLSLDRMNAVYPRVEQAADTAKGGNLIAPAAAPVQSAREQP
jgi:alpha-ketoglutarate-dependent taurine dioxygenase